MRTILSPFLATLVLVSLSFPISCLSDSNANQPKKISVHFSNTSLKDCVSTILKLGSSDAVIDIDSNISVSVTKTAVDTRWNQLLREILIENNLKLTKINGQYSIQLEGPPQLASSKQTITEHDQAHFIKNESSQLQRKCTKHNLVTLGYAFAGGANPYSLVGKCVKLKDVKPIQYMNAKEAIAVWHYRGKSGVVFLENRSVSKPLGEARSLLTESIGVYEYGSVVGSKEIIPHLVIY